MSNDHVHTEEIERRIQECANGMPDSIKDNNRAIDLFDEVLHLLRKDYILRLKQRE